MRILCVLALLATALSSTLYAASPQDWRDIRSGLEIPDENYCDQPYIIITNDGNWLCVLTTGQGHEGSRNQHVVATISEDHGKSWSPLIDIEPATGPEASWVVPLVTPSGRVYAFYTYNKEKICTLKGRETRADMLGAYAYKYSDDNGRTWSSKRYYLPLRMTQRDRNNDFNGKVQMFWGICKPIICDKTVYFTFTKIGKYLVNDTEGWLFKSDNLLTEKDPDKINWQMLPEGDVGIRSPKLGPVQAEHNLVYLNDCDLYCMYRTITGHPAHTYSRDGGHTWTTPVPATYTPNDRKMKNPRACPKVWRTKNGRYLFWFHNHSGKTFEGRNPVWLAAGREIKGQIHWSQPEILFYHPNKNLRMSYPDLVQQDNRWWISETQKSIARVHEIPADFINDLLNQHATKKVTRDGLALELDTKQIQTGSATMPQLPDLSAGKGFTIETWVRFESLDAKQTLFDSTNDAGQGLTLTTTDEKTCRLILNDGSFTAYWDCDRDLLQTEKLHHIVFTVDGGPKIITVLIDGQLCDGGSYRQFGWGRFAQQFGQIKGGKNLRLAPNLKGELHKVRIYNRPLRTSEAIANYNACHFDPDLSGEKS
jgi:hypothetical protein